MTTTVTKSQDKVNHRYNILATETDEKNEKTVTTIGYAKRDEHKPRFFNFSPTDDGRALGLMAETFDRMDDSASGPGLLSSLAKRIAPPEKKELPRPELVKVAPKQPAVAENEQPAVAEKKTGTNN